MSEDELTRIADTVIDALEWSERDDWSADDLRARIMVTLQFAYKCGRRDAEKRAVAVANGEQEFDSPSVVSARQNGESCDG